MQQFQNNLLVHPIVQQQTLKSTSLDSDSFDSVLPLLEPDREPDS